MLHGLTVKEYIHTYHNRDTCYWYDSSLGSEYILSCLFKYSDKDWTSLKEDIGSWQVDKLEILAIVLSCHYHRGGHFLRQKFELFAHIFCTIEKSIAYDLQDELYHLLYDSMYVEIPGLTIETLQKIQNTFDQIKGPQPPTLLPELFVKIQHKIDALMERIRA